MPPGEEKYHDLIVLKLSRSLGPPGEFFFPRLLSQSLEWDLDFPILFSTFWMILCPGFGTRDLCHPQLIIQRFINKQLRDVLKNGNPGEGEGENGNGKARETSMAPSQSLV